MSKYEEFIDKKFGKLKVIKCVGKSQSNSPLFECKCDCGNTTYAYSTQLRNGHKKSCGCLKKEHHFEYKQKIADLEAKLAESESKSYTLESYNNFVNNQCKKLIKENKQLNHQLAEKEKEIEKLKTLIDAIDKYGQYDKDVENLVLLNPENCYSNGHKLIIKTDKQDKIDFAVEQLEKVKEWCEHWKCYTENINYVIVEEKNGIRCNPTLYEEIDNQIKQLKEGK